LHLVKVGAFVLDTASIKIRLILGVWFEGQKVDKNKATRKLKHTNSILEYFECFCQYQNWSL